MSRHAVDSELLSRIKAALPSLEELLDEASSHWGYEDGVYRFYHQSYKVYGLQGLTERLVEALRGLAPGSELAEAFERFVSRGTGRVFTMEVNSRWLEETAPIVEAFFHARFFVEMACRYGRELEEAPSLLPSGWACLLELYRMR
jgi:hypothetical protein